MGSRRLFEHLFSTSARVLELDAWEHAWLPVADATLARRCPQAHARLFLELSQTEGAAVVISVATFVDRRG